MARSPQCCTIFNMWLSGLEAPTCWLSWPSRSCGRRRGLVSRVALAACERLADLCDEVQNRQAAADAGAIEAIVAAMQAHPQVAGVQGVRETGSVRQARRRR